MKRHCLLVAMAFVCVQAFASQQETPLLPEVKAVLEVPDIDESKMDQNAYVHFMAIDAEDDNYLEIGKKIILDGHKRQKEAIQKQDLELYQKPTSFSYKSFSSDIYIEGKLYAGFYCGDLTKRGCFEELLQNPKLIKQLIEKNKTLLTRYKLAREQPYFYSYYLSPYQTPYFPYYIQFSYIELANAVTLINQGDIKIGLGIIEKELAFSKKILSGQSSLIDTTLAIRRILVVYHLLSELLDTDSLKKELDNPQLLALLKPLTDKEQQVIATTMQLEASFIIKYIQIENKWNVLINFFKDAQQYKLYKEAVSKNIAVTYNKNETMNLFYKEFASLSSMATIVLPKASTIYLTLSQDKSELSTLDEIIERYGADNLIENIILASSINITYNKYLYRFYDVSNYLALVTAKLEIKQAGITKKTST